MISGDADNIQIMGAADDVQIMGFGADAAAAGAPMPMVAMVHQPRSFTTMEKAGVAGVALLLVGGLVYALKKK